MALELNNMFSWTNSSWSTSPAFSHKTGLLMFCYGTCHFRKRMILCHNIPSFVLDRRSCSSTISLPEHLEIDKTMAIPYYQTSIITRFAFFFLFFSYVGLNVAQTGDIYEQGMVFSGLLFSI
jgi:hypothetical protein